MSYKSSMAMTSRGATTDAVQSNLASTTKMHHDGDFGDEQIPGHNPPSAFPLLAMNTSSRNESPDNGGVKLSLSSRRRQSSIPNAKVFAGPRPLDLQSNQRVGSGSSKQAFGSLRGASSVASQNPYTNQVTINDVSKFSFASIDPTNTVPKAKPQARRRAKVREKENGKEQEKEEEQQLSIEPNFDFDAFHDNILANSPRLDTFPLPGLPSQFNVPEVPELPRLETKKFPSQPAIPVPTRKASGAGNLGRKNSSASATSRLSVSKLDPMSTGATTTTSILRGRRQTNFPPNAFNNAPTPTSTAKTPRKSAGPGAFTFPNTNEQSDVQRRPSVSGRKSSADSNQSGTSGRGVKRENEDSRETSKSPSTIRVKSVHSTGRQSAKDLFSPSKTPEGLRIVSNNTQSTPNRRSGTPGRTTTPGANNRRQSVATGLGARTISPTDARRLKRMSMVPPAPPLPASRISQAPPTPQPDLILPTCPQPTTPSTGQRKSMTPSSSRTTPDPNRKSYSSGQSLSSNTTYGSLRNSASLSAKLAQPNTSSSRLPTPKPRVETGASPTQEAIPPVPAIPKSYESPASELDQPFFSARSSSLHQAGTPVSDTEVGVAAAEAFARLRIPEEFNNSMLFAEQEYVSNALRARAFEEMDLSGRVPPLGLLPLTSITTERIKLFKDSGISRPATPPEEHHKIKTPSTPMTASKAALFTKSNRAAEADQIKVVRSTTSHFVVRASEPNLHEGLSTDMSAFIFGNDDSSHRSVSPYLSTSAPKTSHEFPSYMRPNFSTELRRTGTHARPNGPRAPSYSIPTKIDEGTPVSEKTSDSSTTTSSASIQRTFSSKRSMGIMGETSIVSPDADKYGKMPPPKLPASATWGNLSNKPSSPVQKTGFFKSRRKTSNSSSNTLAAFGLERQQSIDSTKGQTSIARPSMDSIRSSLLQPSKSGSLLAASHSVKAVQPRTQEPELDRDDLVAEDEMKKLASKRKDFESAARKLDSLQARAHAADRMSPSGALHSVQLNIFERGEIVDFPDVYFTGTKNARKIVGDLASSSSNFGYDDDRGDYNIVDGDHLAYRYEVVDILGKGSFGQVVRCVDHKTGVLVAIKIIRNKKRFHQQALVEVEILQKLREWDPEKKHNVVNFDQSFYFRGHLCISTDLLSMNLYEFIKAHDFRGFSLKLIRRFTKQMLSSLILLHGKKVIHCDLKPENILLAHPARSEIKVIDFGSSCFENEKVYTYIQSRFYRSPEVILGMSYGMPIDMWSLGCILAELYTGYPIFPGENEQEQLACIMEIFGPPEKHLIEKCSRKKLFFDSMGKPRLTVSSKGRRRRPSSKDLRSVLKCEDDSFLDFIARCLRWDPTRRMTPHEALKHEFITGIKPTPISTRKHIANALSTPLKRGNSVATTASTRPLPQPPTTTLKPTISVRQDSLAASPNKVGSRRQSNVNNALHIVSQAKRASHAAMNPASASSVGRLAANHRTANSRSDLAAAAAATSLMK